MSDGGRLVLRRAKGLALAATLALLAIVVLSSPEQHDELVVLSSPEQHDELVAVRPASTGLATELRDVRGQVAGLDARHSGMGASNPDYLPLGSLSAQIGDGADAADTELAEAKQSLAAEKRHKLASQLQAAKSRQEAIREAVLLRAKHMRQWREKQEDRKAKSQARQIQAEERRRGLRAIHSDGGAWLASDRNMPARNGDDDNAALNVWRDGAKTTNTPRRVRSNLRCSLMWVCCGVFVCACACVRERQ